MCGLSEQYRSWPRFIVEIPSYHTFQHKFLHSPLSNCSSNSSKLGPAPFHQFMHACQSMQAWVAFSCSNCTASPFSLNNTAGFAYALAEVELDASGKFGEQLRLTFDGSLRLALCAMQCHVAERVLTSHKLHIQHAMIASGPADCCLRMLTVMQSSQDAVQIAQTATTAWRPGT